MNRGDKYRPVITILKVKNGVPTVISLGGNVYILQAKDGFRGRLNTSPDEQKRLN